MPDNETGSRNVLKFGVTDGEILLRKLQALRTEIAENWEERSARLSDAERSSLRQEAHRVMRLLKRLVQPR